MRNLLKGRRVYIDTNIFLYVALKHPEFYRRCYEVLEMLVDNVFRGYGSYLIAFELFGALSEINIEAAHEAIASYLDMPLTMLKKGAIMLSALPFM